MFKVGDVVQHKTTGKVGKIVGYGCLVAECTYFLTLKVKPLKGIHFRPIEDNMNEWRFVGIHVPSLLRQGLSWY